MPTEIPAPCAIRARWPAERLVDVGDRSDVASAVQPVAGLPDATCRMPAGAPSRTSSCPCGSPPADGGAILPPGCDRPGVGVGVVYPCPARSPSGGLPPQVSRRAAIPWSALDGIQCPGRRCRPAVGQSGRRTASTSGPAPGPDHGPAREDPPAGADRMSGRRADGVGRSPVDRLAGRARSGRDGIGSGLPEPGRRDRKGCSGVCEHLLHNDQERAMPGGTDPKLVGDTRVQTLATVSTCAARGRRGVPPSRRYTCNPCQADSSVARSARLSKSSARSVCSCSRAWFRWRSSTGTNSGPVLK